MHVFVVVAVVVFFSQNAKTPNGGGRGREKRRRNKSRKLEMCMWVCVNVVTYSTDISSYNDCKCITYTWKCLVASFAVDVEREILDHI